ncbi:MAG: hypothetical protein WCI96_08570 [Planctomycetota bacterium]
MNPPSNPESESFGESAIELDGSARLQRTHARANHGMRLRTARFILVDARFVLAKFIEK